MAEAFYSVVLDHPAEAVWAMIRPFGHYAWAGVEAETTIEDGKADDQVGAVRHVSDARPHHPPEAAGAFRSRTLLHLFLPASRRRCPTTSPRSA